MYDVFVHFKALVENQFKHRIVTLYSDNGGEYQALDNFLSTNGISHLTTPPHTPEHNGLSERHHRHIVEIGLSLLTHASMPLTFRLTPLPLLYISSTICPHSHYISRLLLTNSLSLHPTTLNFGCLVAYVIRGQG